MTPPHEQLHFDVEFSALSPPMVTVGEPGDQGAVVTGTHAWGAPWAAATCGLLADVHIPNGGMLLMGAKSIIVAAAAPQVVVGAEVAFNVAGAAPNVHCIIAPVTTSCAITMILLRFTKDFQPKSLPDCRMQIPPKLNNKDAKTRRKIIKFSRLCVFVVQLNRMIGYCRSFGSLRNEMLIRFQRLIIPMTAVSSTSSLSSKCFFTSA